MRQKTISETLHQTPAEVHLLEAFLRWSLTYGGQLPDGDAKTSLIRLVQRCRAWTYARRRHEQ